MHNPKIIIGILAAASTMYALALPPPANAEPAARPALEMQAHPADVAVVQWQYVPAEVTIEQGETLTFGNYDPVAGVPAHSLDEAVPRCTTPPYTGNNPGRAGCRQPMFSSGLVDHGHVHRVHGVEDLLPGRYGFTCQVHPFMTGTLIVEPIGGRLVTNGGKGHQ